MLNKITLGFNHSRQAITHHLEPDIHDFSNTYKPHLSVVAGSIDTSRILAQIIHQFLQEEGNGVSILGEENDTLREIVSPQVLHFPYEEEFIMEVQGYLSLQDTLRTSQQLFVLPQICSPKVYSVFRQLLLRGKFQHLFVIRIQSLPFQKMSQNRHVFLQTGKMEELILSTPTSGSYQNQEFTWN